jgi:hypothetical protein
MGSIKGRHADDAYLALESAYASTIDGVDDTDLETIQDLLATWRAHYPRNLVRTLYYTAHNQYEGVAYSIPASMRAMAKPMIGWCAKSVRSLSDLSSFDGFDADDSISVMVDRIASDNMLDSEVGETIVSAYTHGCSFLTVSADPDDPSRILLMPRSADWSAALWDRRRRRIGAALTITDKDSYGRITSFQAWLPDKVYEVYRQTGGRWAAERLETNMDRPSVVPFVHDPQLNRPFGRSRVSRTLMALTDFGLRTMVRMEATAEFYSAPRIWFLGASKKQMSPDTWSSIVSVINGLPADKNGNKPTMQQLTQASMQPHSDMLKTIALMVSSETDIPVNDLGITMDNPASAEAMAMAERRLSRAADRQNRLFGRALNDAMGMALRFQGVDDEQAISSVNALWAPTKETSDAAKADWYTKAAGVNPTFGSSDVGLRRLGLDETEIRSFRAYEQKQRSQAALDRLKVELDQTDTDTQNATTTRAAAAPSGNGWVTRRS